MPETEHSLEVRRDDLRVTRIVSTPVPATRDGQVALRVERFGLTANNVTYGVVGDRIGYWRFFPAAEGWGRIPVWGFANVMSSGVQEIPPGTRVFGFFPMSTHLVVEPTGMSRHGFTDGSAHRTSLPPVYNGYRRVDVDALLPATAEALHAVFYPLLATSFVIDDFLADQNDFGADRIVLSSASSKTALGTALAVSHRSGDKPALVGLTSPQHVGFVERLGCYTEVTPYNDVASLDPAAATVYVDFAGNADVRRAVHEHLGDALVKSYMVGATHWEQRELPAELPGPVPTMFFAPAQISKRLEEWGSAGYQERLEPALERLIAAVSDSIAVVDVAGVEGLQGAWLATLDGSSDPAVATVVEFGR
ncbi:MAG TPA: DUF2855 family protein [Acidimicrobiia bacterium]|jgi:hypothetical protein|nr:DUF2855 family protein [Acidimicrobiia bacterium]